MRAMLMAAVLPLLLLAPPIWAFDTDIGQTPGETQGNGQAVQPDDTQGDTQAIPAEHLPLLVPTDQMDDFANSLSSSLAQDVEVANPPEIVSVNGTEYAVVIVPLDRLEDLHRDIGQKPIHDEIKVIVADGDTPAVADLPSVEMALGIPGMDQETA